MPKIRHLFPGGNTCFGFYSYYNYIVSPNVKRKIILKGGPGVGKSTFMRKMGEDFSSDGYDVEYHWCSSDNDSLDGVVIGDQELCILDGTAPHVVDPRFPGAVDEIINLGVYWNKKKLVKNRNVIVNLTQDIGRCFDRAYIRLKESRLAMEEWISYYHDAINEEAVNRNILALTLDFIPKNNTHAGSVRHLFAAAITPLGIVHRAESLLDSDLAVFAIKGSPGSGKTELFINIFNMINLHGINAEVYHNPADPDEIDLILLPTEKIALVNISSPLVDYETAISGRKIKRMLDFDALLSKEMIDTYAHNISSAQERYETAVRDAVSHIHNAKELHDELESYYTPAMDLDAIEQMRQELFLQLKEEFA
ncbi:PRK06851 family protein [Syntrophomonas palmitatica]|uniref:PRK06851 family protein n=1 Tax=Syntrophomonas palmitatica TaxID=402877 RepID=UPI0006D01C59|nr:PRK06851 family protein [Syntrophomonas palmitatica]